MSVDCQIPQAETSFLFQQLGHQTADLLKMLRFRLGGNAGPFAAQIRFLQPQQQFQPFRAEMAQPSANDIPLGRNRGHVQFDQLHHLLTEGRRCLQTAQNVIGKLCPRLSMTVEMAHALVVPGECSRLSHIMQQCCPAEG